MTRHPIVFALGVIAVATLSACNDTRNPSNPVLAATGPTASPTLECKQAPPDQEIPLPIAPPGQRVDLAPPTFANPTNVINPLFPIRKLSQVILVGFVDGIPFRVETTLLPGTQPIDLGDRVVETLTSQYVAYLDRRIQEVALDWYAQADDGSVWYFGEDVFNYEDGEIADTDGTWLACRDGPVAMIMPALPQVGNVYRPENIFGFVFEEVEVKLVGQTVDGPLGPVPGAIIVQELHMDGTYEGKTFAPGYGEFSTGSGADLEALALAVPTDASPLNTPAELKFLLAGARRVFQAARSGNWVGASNTVNDMNRAWGRYQTGVLPRLLEPLMAEALEDLTGAVAGRDPATSRQAAVDVSRIGLDLLLQYRSRIEVDFMRLDLWFRQLLIDGEAGDDAGITSDIAILERILERLANTGAGRDREDVRRVRQHLAPVRTAANRGDSAAVLAGARRLEPVLSGRVREQE